jgi:DNA-binding beta-propeller fold protein YncE
VAVLFVMAAGLAATVPSGAAEPAPATAKVVLIGDSIRLGYAPIVARELDGVAVVVSPKPNGGDSANVLRHLEEWVIREQPTLVHFNCGIHDMKKSRVNGQFQVPPETYAANLRTIVGRIRAGTKATVVFATTTGAHDDRAARARTRADYELLEASAEQYNRIARTVMDELGVPVDDLHALLADPETRAGLMGSDGIHFTADGYRRLGTEVARFLRQHLRAERADYSVVPGWPGLPGGFQFGQVSAVAADASDRVFVFHRGEHPVVVFDRAGKLLRWWGDGLVKKAHGLRIDGAGNVWITDIGAHLVRKFDREGTLLMTLGRPGEPGAGRERFNQPTDVAVAPDGTFYVSDGYGNSRVVKFAADGRYLQEWGKKGRGEGEFNLPHAIVRDDRGRIYVGDRENDRVQVFDAEGQFLAQWAEGGAPYGLALTTDGRLFVADGRANRVTILDLAGKALGHWGNAGTAPGAFSMPHAVCLDTQGDVYVAEVNGQRVQKFTAK